MRNGRLGAAAAVLTLATAACSADKPQAAAPSETPPSTSPSPTLATVTAAPPSPEAAIRAWFQASDQMQATGDPRRFRSLSTDDCSGCKKMAKTVEKIYSAGGYMQTPETKILSIEGRDIQGRFQYVVRAKLKPTDGRASAGAEEQHFAGGRDNYILAMLGENGSWKVRAVVRTPV